MIRPLATTEPPAGDPGSLYEVVDGIKVVKPMSTYENVVAGLLFNTLCNHVSAHALGRAVVEVMFDLPGLPNDRRPDVGFVSYDRWPRDRGIPRTTAWSVVPDLAVEVVSPSDEFRDILQEVGEYFQAGVRLVWLVVPGEDVVYAYTSRTDVRILSRTDELVGDAVLPGYRLPVADLFPRSDDEPR